MMTTMAAASASLLPNLTKNQARRGMVVAAAKATSTGAAGEKVMSLEINKSEEQQQSSSSSNNGRREMVFAAAAAVAAASMAKIAIADEPKAGTPEAKKKYAPICVTMPTAKVCRK